MKEKVDGPPWPRNKLSGDSTPSAEMSEQCVSTTAPRGWNRAMVLGLGYIFIGIFFLLISFWFYSVKPDAAALLHRAFSEPDPLLDDQLSVDGQQGQKNLSARPLPTMAPLTELKTTVLHPGSGQAVAKGQHVTVHATGSVLNADGTAKKFWSTKDPGQQPFTWQAGLGQVIAGWDQGVLGMNLGETRMIYIPAKMGYGANGFPAWGIPANADLQFEIECLKIQ